MKWKVPPMWQDGDCWIIGGGPSINHLFGVPDEIVNAQKTGALKGKEIGQYIEPLLKDSRVIAVNNAYQLGSFSDMLVFGDQTYWGYHQQNKASMPLLKVTCCSKLANEPGLYYLKRADKVFGLTTDRTKQEVSWNHNSGAMAINVAVLLGVKRIFLLGFDMKAESKDVTHWHYQHLEKLKGKPHSQVPYSLHLAGFPAIAEEAKAAGVEIYNVNEPDRTDLKVFPIINLGTALKMANKSSRKNEVVLPIASRIAVCCVLWKGFFHLPRNYNEAWAIKLYEMVRNHLFLAFDFYCLTNQEFSHPGIKIIPLKKEYGGWWSKMEMFQQESFQQYDKVLYLDLDVFIRKNLEPLFKFAEAYGGPIVAGQAVQNLNDHKKDGKHVLFGIQSALMIFKPKEMLAIGKEFDKDSERIMSEFRGDQDWLKYKFPKMDTFPKQLTCKSFQWERAGRKFKGDEIVVYACPDKNDTLAQKYPEFAKLWGGALPEPLVNFKKPKKVNVMCFYWMNKTNPRRGWNNVEVARAYIARLFRAVKRNLDCEFDFYCFTTEKKALEKNMDKGVILRDLQSPSMLGCFPKISAYNPDYDFTEGALNITFDLDTVITGNLNFLLGYQGNFMTRGAPPNGKGVPQGRAEGGLVVWRHHPELKTLWEKFQANPKMFDAQYEGKERLVYREYVKADLIIDKYPGAERSYMWEIVPNQNKLLEGCRIVSFHSRPHPHEIMNLKWVSENWR